jgi:hypothetical protein
MNGTQRAKASVQNDLRFHDSPPLRLTSKLPLGPVIRPPIQLVVAGWMTEMIGRPPALEKSSPSVSRLLHILCENVRPWNSDQIESDADQEYAGEVRRLAHPSQWERNRD